MLKFITIEYITISAKSELKLLNTHYLNCNKNQAELSFILVLPVLFTKVSNCHFCSHFSPSAFWRQILQQAKGAGKVSFWSSTSASSLMQAIKKLKKGQFLLLKRTKVSLSFPQKLLLLAKEKILSWRFFSMSQGRIGKEKG